MEKEEFQRQNDIAVEAADSIAGVVEAIQLGNLHDKKCGIYGNTEDTSRECDCVVDEIFAKLDAVSGLILNVMEERQKDVT